jgi:DNA polymerase-4
MSVEQLTEIALALREKVGLNPKQRFRLVGVGLSNFEGNQGESDQPELFDRLNFAWTRRIQ